MMLPVDIRWRRALLLAAGLTTSAQAQVFFNGETYRQAFDSLPSSGLQNLVGTGVLNAQVAVPGVEGWQIARTGGTTTADVQLRADPGVLTGGRAYSYGAVDSTDRALGSLGSGTASMSFGAVLVNNTGQALESVTIQFTREIWRVQGTTTANANEDRIGFAYGVGTGALSTANFLSSAAMIPLPELDLVSLAANAITGAVDGSNPERAVDGNQAANRQVLSATVAGLNWGPGESFYFRWRDTDSSGFDAGLAIDDLTLTATPVPEPEEYATGGALGLLGLGLFRRWLKRRATKA